MKECTVFVFAKIVLVFAFSPNVRTPAGSNAPYTWMFATPPPPPNWMLEHPLYRTRLFQRLQYLAISSAPYIKLQHPLYLDEIVAVCDVRSLQGADPAGDHAPNLCLYLDEIVAVCDVRSLQGADPAGDHAPNLWLVATPPIPG